MLAIPICVHLISDTKQRPQAMHNERVPSPSHPDVSLSLSNQGGLSDHQTRPARCVVSMCSYKRGMVWCVYGLFECF